MDYRAVMSGRRRDPGAVLLRGLLWAASTLYGLAIRLRNRRYDTGRTPIHRAGVPVISVGNLTTGGTGKTPLVAYLATTLRSHGYRVSLISRGYGRGEAALNDEALELEQRLPDVPHVQDPDRVAAATVAVEELETQLILMDDGFQHRRLHRDLDIVVIDATCPYGYGHLLPRGMLREPLSSIARADVAVLSRSNYVSPAERQAIREAYQRKCKGENPQLLWVEAEHRPARLIDYRDRSEPLEQLSGKRVLAFCGIGNPEAFQRTLEDCGAEVVDLHALPDHARYDADTVGQLEQWGKSQQAGCDAAVDWMVCTQKDLVKIRAANIAGLPLRAVQIDLHVQPHEPLVQRLLEISSMGPRPV